MRVDGRLLGVYVGLSDMKLGIDESRRSARVRHALSNGARSSTDRPPRLQLVADVGPLHTHLSAVSGEDGAVRPVAERKYPTGAYEAIGAMARAFLLEAELEVETACISVPCMVTRGTASLDDPPWRFDEAELARQLAVQNVWLLNDIVATATAIPLLPRTELHRVKDGEPVEGGPIAVLVPGERLSVCLLMPDSAAASGYRAHPSAGSHAAAAPMTPIELDLVRRLWHSFEEPSFEHVPSAVSIPELYDFLRDRDPLIESPYLAAMLPSARDRTRIILDAACNRVELDPLARSTLDLYLQILGAHAANLALTVFATGGIYLAGKLARRLKRELVSPAFLEPLLRVGMACEPLERLPVFVLRGDVAMLGAAHEGLRLSRALCR